MNQQDQLPPLPLSTVWQLQMSCTAPQNEAPSTHCRPSHLHRHYSQLFLSLNRIVFCSGVMQSRSTIAINVRSVSSLLMFPRHGFTASQRMLLFSRPVAQREPRHYSPARSNRAWSAIVTGDEMQAKKGNSRIAAPDDAEQRYIDPVGQCCH